MLDWKSSPASFSPSGSENTGCQVSTPRCEIEIISRLGQTDKIREKDQLIIVDEDPSGK